MRPRISISSGCDRRHHAGALQRAHAARGQREVDRAAALGGGAAWIGAALEDPDVQAASRQQQRQQGTREAGADDG